jgi:hypothetical protein
MLIFLEPRVKDLFLNTNFSELIPHISIFTYKIIFPFINNLTGKQFISEDEFTLIHNYFGELPNIIKILICSKDQVKYQLAINLINKK